MNPDVDNLSEMTDIKSCDLPDVILKKKQKNFKFDLADTTDFEVKVSQTSMKALSSTEGMLSPCKLQSSGHIVV